MDDDPSERRFLGRIRFPGWRRSEATELPLNGIHTPESPQDMRLRISEFEAARVEDVMIPRAEIVAIDADSSFDDMIQQFADASHSRMPVYRETLDDPIGFIHIKDVVAALADLRKEPPSFDADAPTADLLARLVRDILFVPASMRLTDLLVKMQTSRIHLALVVDEYGGTDGLVSLEDLVEQIVGEIEDEHDETSPILTRRGKGVWDADAKMEIEDVEDQVGLSLTLPDFADEIDTLGGVAFAIAGRVPQRGEILRHPAGLDLEILEADPRRIKRLRLRYQDSQASDQPSAPPSPSGD